MARCKGCVQISATLRVIVIFHDMKVSPIQDISLLKKTKIVLDE